MAGRDSVKAPEWLFYFAIVAAWLLGVELGVLSGGASGLPGRLPALVVWSCVVLGIAFLVLIGRRALVARRQTNHLIAELEDSLGSFGMLTDSFLSALPTDELLQQLLARVCDVLGTEVAAILLVQPDGTFDYRATHGLEADRLEAFVDLRGGMVESIAGGRGAQVIGDSDVLGVLSSHLNHPLSSAAGSAIVVEGRFLGVFVVGGPVRRRFDEARLQLVQMVADRAGIDLEFARISDAQRQSRVRIERARHHAVILANASKVLLTAKDSYGDHMASLVEVVVPDFADRCIIDLLDDGGVVPGAAASSLAQVSPDGHEVAVDIQAGDSVFGTLTVVTGSDRPAYEASDIAVVVELAGRAAVTVERVIRYGAAQESARSSERRAAQLHQLVEVAIDVQQMHNQSEVVTRIAERARQVFDAQTAIVQAAWESVGPRRAVAEVGRDTVFGPPEGDRFGDERQGPMSNQGAPWSAEGWHATQIAGNGRRAGGVLAIHASRDEFTASDEAILVLLAQMASSALDRALLNHTIETNEARWRVLVEAAPISIVETDLDGVVRWWNRAATALFAWPEPQRRLSPEQDSPASWSGELPDNPSFSADTAGKLRSLWADALDGKRVIDREIVDTSVGGELRDLAVSVTSLQTAGGAVHGTLTLVADVTDRHRLEAELHRVQRMKAIGQLAGGVAHDFNNLLTLITGYTELLQHHLDVDQRSVELVNGVHSAVRRASLLTGQLLTISRRKTGHPVILAPTDSLRSASEVLERVLGAKIELIWNLDPDAGQVSIDPAELEQVILNLAINARDAMPDGGVLDIAVAPVALDADQSEKLDLLPGDYVRISVTDTGAGMNPETQQRCFEPLFTTKGPSRGTGLGLAAVKGVVEEGGGTVTVRSSWGKGTTFTVHLPAVDRRSTADPPVGRDGSRMPDPVGAGNRPDTRPTRTGAEEGSADARTILIADDDERLLHLISQALTRHGYRVLEASSGDEALTVAQQWRGPIDAMVSDVVMPGLNGPSAAAAVLANRPKMRVLFMSGGVEGAELAAMPPHFRRILTKPFQAGQLVTRLGELLDS